MKICVYGAASPTVDQKYVTAVEEMGRVLARRGHSLVFGGGGNGMMGAASRGVRDGGGHITGVIPSFFKTETVEELCDFCDEIIYTETMRERKQIMEDSSDAFIVTPGGIGTFEEFFEILTLKQLCRHNKPIAIYNVDGYYNELEVVMEAAISKNFVRQNCRDLYFITDDCNKLFDYIEEPIKEIRTIKELKDG